MSKARRGRFIIGIFILAACISLMQDSQVSAGDVSDSPVFPDYGEIPVRVSTPGNTVITYRAGEPQKLPLVVENLSEKNISDIKIEADMEGDGWTWPFKTEYQCYSENKEYFAGYEKWETNSFNFTQREDLKTGTERLKFIVSATDYEPRAFYIYVNVTSKQEETKQEKEPESKTNSSNDGSGQQANPVYSFADGGGFSNAGASFSDGSQSASHSVPRVIVTGFETDPAQVQAGSNFTLTVHLKNTSKATRVSNMLFDISAPTEGKDEQTTAPAFLPSSGASSIYLDGMNADSTSDISIQLNAKADLVQKPYNINLNMKYEDGSAAQIEGASNIAIPVRQQSRFELSEFEISPESIAVGEEANVLCNLYNMGRIKLYNVKAAFEGTVIKREELFLGNVDSGGTAAIDAMLEGAKAGNGPSKVTMTLSYEDEAGNVSTVQKELELNVTEKVADDDITAAMQAQEEAKTFPVIPVAIAAAAVFASIVAVSLIRKKKKKRLFEEEEGLLDEVDRSAEDER